MTETFHIIPSTARTLWTIPAIVAGIVLLVGLILLAAARGGRTATFEVSAAGLRLRGDLYGRMIPAGSLDLAGARAVDLSTDRSLAPTLRTMGTALPGYRAGWFRLRNGQKGLLYLTDETRVAYVPTTEGYGVLLSVPDPAGFVASLHREMGR